MPSIVIELRDHFPSLCDFEACVGRGTAALLPLMEELSDGSHPTVLGLDAEWTTTVREVDGRKHRSVSKLALLQLALPEDVTVCVRLCEELFATDVPTTCVRTFVDTLRSVLSNRKLFKCGVGVENDVKKLLADWGLATRSWVDLVVLQSVLPEERVDSQRLASANLNGLSDRKEARPRSLQAMSSLWTGKQLGKALEVVLSDWADASLPLSEAQLCYAVEDAKASRAIAVQIIRAIMECDRNADEAFNLERVAECPVKGGSGSHSAPTLVKTHRLLEPPAKAVANASTVFECRKTTYYDNIQTFDPNGVLLFTVDKKKALWYVEKKKLGRVLQYRRVLDDTLVDACDLPIDDACRASGDYVIASIQLTFTPDFERFNDSHIRRDLEYFRQPKDNKCVVCGVPDTVIRCAVVPLMYRKFFPKTYVSHNSYDLLLVCPQCFVNVNFHHDAERERIAVEFGFPLATNRRATVVDAGSTSTTGGASIFEFTRATRHTVQQVIKYSCALLRNLRSAPMKEGVSRLTEGEMSSAGGTVEQHEQRRVLAPSTNRRRSSRNSVSKATRHAAWIPLEKLQMMESFVLSHCCLFPFFDSTQQPCQPTTLTEAILEVLSQSDVHIVVSAAVAQEFPAVLAPVVDRDGQSCESYVQQPQTVDNHAAFVVSQLLQKYAGCPDAGIGEFILRWRRLFVERLCPKHLPTGWRIDDGIVLP